MQANFLWILIISFAIAVMASSGLQIEKTHEVPDAKRRTQNGDGISMRKHTFSLLKQLSPNVALLFFYKLDGRQIAT